MSFAAARTARSRAAVGKESPKWTPNTGICDYSGVSPRWRPSPGPASAFYNKHAGSWRPRALQAGAGADPRVLHASTRADQHRHGHVAADLTQSSGLPLGVFG